MTDDGPDPFTNLFEAPAKFARALFAPMAEAVAPGSAQLPEERRHVHFEADPEAVLPNTRLPTPAMPTPAEREEHEKNHFPFRSWCSACVDGKKDELPHIKCTQTSVLGPCFPFGNTIMTGQKRSQIIRDFLWGNSLVCHNLGYLDTGAQD